MRRFSSIADLEAASGHHLGYSGWFEISQQRVDTFAAATEDHQWIHVDPARAARGPYATAVAHGYLVLALLPRLGAEIYSVDGVGATINYGVNRVRFPNAVPVGSRIKAGAELISATPVRTGLQALVRYTVEVENQPKPACVAETIRLLQP